MLIALARKPAPGICGGSHCKSCATTIRPGFSRFLRQRRARVAQLERCCAQALGSHNCVVTPWSSSRGYSTEAGDGRWRKVAETCSSRRPRRRKSSANSVSETDLGKPIHTTPDGVIRNKRPKGLPDFPEGSRANCDISP